MPSILHSLLFQTLPPISKFLSLRSWSVGKISKSQMKNNLVVLKSIFVVNRTGVFSGNQRDYLCPQWRAISVGWFTGESFAHGGFKCTFIPPHPRNPADRERRGTLNQAERLPHTYLAQMRLLLLTRRQFLTFSKKCIMLIKNGQKCSAI